VAMDQYKNCTASAVLKSKKEFCNCVNAVNCFFHSHGHCKTGPHPYVQHMQHNHACSLYGPCVAE
jgi:hypothetical protein